MAGDVVNRRLQAWGLALGLFVAGAAGGVAVDRLLQPGRGAPRGPPAPEEILQRLQRDLDLDADQSSAIRVVLDERQRALSTLFGRMDPEAEAIRKDANARIRALLSPDQQVRFDARVSELERRREELRRRFQAARPQPAR